MKDTRIHLVEELKKLPQTPDIVEMIREALAGEYHDFKNVKYPCGKRESAQRLKNMGHIELSNRIKEGEFDEDADRDDIIQMRRDGIEMGLSELQMEKLGLSLEKYDAAVKKT